MLLTFGESAVHAAEFDGTAIETSLTATLRVTLHKKGSLPRKISKLTFPLLENANEYIVHGFNYGVSPSPLQSAPPKPTSLHCMHIRMGVRDMSAWPAVHAPLPKRHMV